MCTAHHQQQPFGIHSNIIECGKMNKNIKTKKKTKIKITEKLKA